LVGLLLLSSTVQAREQIPVWTYYTSSPFITGEGTGLSYEFIALLNRYSKGKYHFELTPLPRTRINRHLEDGRPGLVLFVNWAWMGDKDKTKYLWSPALLSDRNEIVSRAFGKPPNRIEYSGPASLEGAVFGGELGRRYKGLEASFADGSIIRRNARREQQNLDMLVLGRIDVTSGSASTIRYQVNQKGLKDKLYFSPQPLFSYTRHFLIAPQLAPLSPFLSRFVTQLQQDPDWTRIKKRYFVD
jgi:polar amino acid transport system substrate-binding protein